MSKFHSYQLQMKIDDDEMQLPMNEFVLMLDFVGGLDLNVEKVRVKYCFFRASF